jgi:hypothetical protein
MVKEEQRAVKEEKPVKEETEKKEKEAETPAPETAEEEQKKPPEREGKTEIISDSPSLSPLSLGEIWPVFFTRAKQHWTGAPLAKATRKADWLT